MRRDRACLECGRTENRDCGRVVAEALDPGRVDKLDAGRGVEPEDKREVLLETGLERLEAGCPCPFTERLEPLEGIMSMTLLSIPNDVAFNRRVQFRFAYLRGS